MAGASVNATDKLLGVMPVVSIVPVARAASGALLIVPSYKTSTVRMSPRPIVGESAARSRPISGCFVDMVSLLGLFVAFEVLKLRNYR